MLVLMTAAEAKTEPEKISFNFHLSKIFIKNYR